MSREPEKESIINRLRRISPLSATSIIRHARRTVAGVPEFIGVMMSHPKAPKIFSDAVKIFLNDLLPMAAIHAAYAYLTYPEEEKNNVEAHSIAAIIGVYFIYVLTALLLVPQRLRLLAHTTTLALGYPARFDDVSQSAKARQLKTNICDHCTAGRYVKGEFRSAMIVYFALLGVVRVMSGMPLLGWLIAPGLQVLLNAQVVGEYRLANDGVCDRHRMVYYRQYPEFFIALGLCQFMVTRAIAWQFSFIPGVKMSDMESAVTPVVLLYFMGLAHHVYFPDPVKEVTRRLHDPLSVTRAAVSGLFDLLIPGALKQFDRWVMNQKKMSWKKSACHEWLQYFQVFMTHRCTKRSMQLFLPRMYRDLDYFLQDWAVRQYWPAVSRKSLMAGKELLDRRDVILKFGSMSEFYEAYIKPMRQGATIANLAMMIVLPPMSAALEAMPYLAMAVNYLGTAVTLIGGIASVQSGTKEVAMKAKEKSKSVSDFLSLFQGMPKGVVILLIGLLRNEQFVTQFKAFLMRLQQKTNECVTSQSGCQARYVDEDARHYAESFRNILWDEDSRLPPQRSEADLIVVDEPPRSPQHRIAPDDGFDFATQDGTRYSEPLFTRQPAEEDDGFDFGTVDGKKNSEPFFRKTPSTEPSFAYPQRATI